MHPNRGGLLPGNRSAPVRLEEVVLVEVEPSDPPHRWAAADLLVVVLVEAVGAEPVEGAVVLPSPRTRWAVAGSVAPWE